MRLCIDSVKIKGLKNMLRKVIYDRGNSYEEWLNQEEISRQSEEYERRQLND